LHSTHIKDFYEAEIPNFDIKMLEEDRKELIKKLFDEAAEDGHLAKEAAKAVALKLEEEMSDEEVDTFFKEHDADGDGKITFEEFLTKFDK